MHAKILITNHGTHPPEKWAMTTAESIVEIGSDAADDRLLAAQRLQLAIAEALVPHHAKVQEDEKSRLNADVNHINTPHDASEYLDSVLADVQKAAVNSPWGKQFTDPAVQVAIKQVAANHFMTAQHIERLWHADRNPNCEVSKQYKKRYFR